VNAPLISVTVNAPPNSGAAWIDAAQQGSVIYFLFAQHIERYDTASAAWLPSVSFSQTATAFCNASDGIYVAFGRTLARYTFDLSSETTLTNLGGSVVAVFSFGAYVYAVSEDSFPGVIYPVDRNTGAVGTTSTIYVDTAVAFAVVPSANKAFCPDTIWDYMSFNLASSGAVTSNNFKYYDTFPGGNRIYVFPDQSRVADNGGTIYSVATDSIAGSFAGSFTDMTFLADGTPVILRGSTLYEFGGAALAEIGHASLAVTGARIFGQGQNVLVFYPSAAAGNGYVGLSQFAANGFVASYPSAPAVNPAGLSFTPDAVAQDASGVVYLFGSSSFSVE
jgi:hypothetical protein